MSSAPDDPSNPTSSLDDSGPPAPPPKDGRPTAVALPQGRAMPTSPPVTSPTATPSMTSGSSTPTIESSIFSPAGSRLSLRGSSPARSPTSQAPSVLVAQAFAPHVSILSSPDCEELLRHKGLSGGLLELLRPFGEQIQGRVVVRDSTGASRPWDDFGIRFTGLKDGLEAPRLGRGRSESQPQTPRGISDEYRPARWRSGGDVGQVEQLVERRLDSEEVMEDQSFGDLREQGSPFYDFYLQKLLSGPVLSPHETFAHPVALVIAISSRSPSPIEELRNLYADSNNGEHRLPPWVNNEFLRYYVLVHDEDYDDIKKSTTLYEQMKRHFGIHCHLLRLRSTQCLPSDDGSTTLPPPVWTSSAEDLSSISQSDEAEEPQAQPYIFESDAVALRSFVRELTTQSLIPVMERQIAVWNDQVASRRRGISGRFMSLSKRFTPFSSRSASPAGPSGSNYDSAGGFYRPDAPEAVLRKLADYALMLRDWRLAMSTYEMLCGDFKGDKAWRYYAGANEMAAITTLLVSTSTGSGVSTRTREAVEQYLENGYYSYAARATSPYYALRAVLLAAEFLKVKGGNGLDDASRWLGRLVDDRIVGPVGHALLLERIGGSFAAKKGAGQLAHGGRRRKAGMWYVLASGAWVEMDKHAHAGRTLRAAVEYYVSPDDDTDHGLQFEGMKGFIANLEEEVEHKGRGNKNLDGQEEEEKIEVVEQITEKVDQRTHRRSVSAASFDPLGAVPLSPMATVPDREVGEDGFE